MSALGQKQTFAVQKGMSALPPIATAKADMCAAQGLTSSHDDPQQHAWERRAVGVMRRVPKKGPRRGPTPRRNTLADAKRRKTADAHVHSIGLEPLPQVKSL